MAEHLSAASPLVVLNGHMHTLVSPDGRRWRVTVALPPVPTAFGRTRAVYVLDPASHFMHAVGSARNLARTGGERFPQDLMIVGVGPDTDDNAELNVLRNYYLTPTERSGREADAFQHGGADDFADILASLFPSIESQYNADPNDRTFAGHSFGGLFGSHVLLHRPQLFQRYLLSSPSLWWDDGFELREEQRLVAGSTDRTARVFLSAGQREEGEPPLQWPTAPLATDRMVSRMCEFEERLRARGHSSVTSWVVPNEHHTTVPPAAFMRGLFDLFAT